MTHGAIPDVPDRRLDSSVVASSLERRTILILWILALAIGCLKAWAMRYHFSPDVTSYLDMADAYLRGDWRMALNGWWNPFYTWLLCLVLLVTKQHPYWEIPAVNVLGFGLYVAGLACFHFFLRQVARYNAYLSIQPKWQGTAVVPPRWVLIFGYLLYIWSSLYMISFATGADQCLANFVYLAFGLLFWIGTEPTNWKPFALLGLVLGCGYLTKAIMLPLTLVFLAISLCMGADLRKALPRGMLAVLMFVIVASPFIAALSKSKGRFTVSDTGSGNYAFYVCMDSHDSYYPPYYPWQGDIPNCGTPRHPPPRKLYTSPAVYEFGTAFPHATYGLWYDPSYWYEGSIPHFTVRNQLDVLLFNAKDYSKLFYSTKQLALLAGLVVLVGMSWRLRHRANGMATHWLFLLPAVVALSFYWAVHVEERYVCAFVTVLVLSLFTGVRLPDSHESRALLVVVSASMVLFVSFFAVLPRSLTYVREIGRKQHGSNDVHVRVAKDLKELGIQPGDKVASIGNAFNAYWARLSRVHIVAEILPTDAPDYWQADADTKARVRAALASTGARAVVTDSRPKDDVDAHWQQIGGRGGKDLQFYISLLAR